MFDIEKAERVRERGKIDFDNNATPDGVRDVRNRVYNLTRTSLRARDDNAIKDTMSSIERQQRHGHLCSQTFGLPVTPRESVQFSPSQKIVCFVEKFGVVCCVELP